MTNIVKIITPLFFIVGFTTVVPAFASQAPIIDAGSLRLQKRVQYLSTQSSLTQSDFAELNKSKSFLDAAAASADEGNFNLARVQIHKGIKQFNDYKEQCTDHLEQGIDSHMDLLSSILGADPNTSDEQRERFRVLANDLKEDLRHANDEFRVALLKLQLKRIYYELQGPAGLPATKSAKENLQKSLKKSIITATQALLRLTEQDIQMKVLETVTATWGTELEFFDGVGSADFFPSIIDQFAASDGTLPSSFTDLVDANDDERFTEWLNDISINNED
jgi:hypothetical protein